MAAPGGWHGIVKNVLISNINRAAGIQSCRFYASWLKRRPVRVMTIKEADDLGKHPQKSRRKAPPQILRQQPLIIKQRENTTEVIDGFDTGKEPCDFGAHTEADPVEDCTAEIYTAEVDATVVTNDASNEAIQEDYARIRSMPVILSAVENEHQEAIQEPAKPSRTKNKVNKAKKDEIADRVVFPENVMYEKLAAGDPRFGPLVNEAKLPKSRDKNSTILLEGKRLVSEGVNASLNVKSLYFTNAELLVDLPLEQLVQSGTMLYQVSAKHMKVWSDTVTPSGIMAICKMPRIVISGNEEPRLPVTIICDHIEDHGFLGTLIRSAAAAACSKVIVTRGCVDPWEPKALRAGMGAHFHIPVLGTDWEHLTSFISPEANLFLVNNRQVEKQEKQNAPRPISEQLLLESEDPNTPLKQRHVKMFERVQLPTKAYGTVDYSDGDEVVLVVGNDNVPSAEAKKFAFLHKAQVVYVPGANKINNTIISSVVLFEIRRQLTRHVDGDSNN